MLKFKKENSLKNHKRRKHKNINQQGICEVNTFLTRFDTDNFVETETFVTFVGKGLKAFLDTSFT